MKCGTMQYFENACYIADTAESAAELMKQSMSCTGRYRVDAVRQEQIMNDYGCSCGEYAMESGAFARFERIARATRIEYESRPEDGDVPLTIVQVHGVQISD